MGAQGALNSILLKKRFAAAQLFCARTIVLRLHNCSAPAQLVKRFHNSSTEILLKRGLPFVFLTAYVRKALVLQKSFTSSKLKHATTILAG
jgi:hypothetical protein